MKIIIGICIHKKVLKKVKNFKFECDLDSKSESDLFSSNSSSIKDSQLIDRFYNQDLIEKVNSLNNFSSATALIKMKDLK